MFIQFNKNGCFEHITVGENIYLDRCVSLLAPECAVCVYMCVCVCVWYQIRLPAKKLHVSDLSKLDALLHKTRIKVLRLDMCPSISLSKIAHQMCCDHPFSQRNKITELAVGVEVGGHMEGEGVKFEKGGMVNTQLRLLSREFS